MVKPFSDRRKTGEKITAAINANLAEMDRIQEQIRLDAEARATWIAKWKAERDVLKAEGEAVGLGVDSLLERIRALLPVPYLED